MEGTFNTPPARPSRDERKLMPSLMQTQDISSDMSFTSSSSIEQPETMGGKVCWKTIRTLTIVTNGSFTAWL